MASKKKKKVQVRFVNPLQHLCTRLPVQNYPGGVHPLSGTYRVKKKKEKEVWLE